MSFIAKAVVVGKTLTGKGSNTVDPQYIEADQIFKKIKADSEQIVGSLTIMQSHFGNLSKAVGVFGNDIKGWYMDTSDESQLFKSQTASVFAQNFSSFTSDFFMPRFEYNVIKKLSAYQNEIQRLDQVQEMVEKSRKKYDESQTMYDYLISERDSRANANEFLEFINPLTLIKPNLVELDQQIRQAQQQLSADKAEYERYNSDFINSVKNLSVSRTESLDGSFKNLICIMSQYIMMVFKDMQKFKTAFPNDLFMPKTPKQQEIYAAQKQNRANNQSNSNNNNNDNNNNNNDDGNNESNSNE